ncbi:MAG: hypothetical protein AB8H03_00510 [Saprospiraceae bacterium]
MKIHIACTLLFFLLFSSSCAQTELIDYVELEIPEELKDNPKAVAYLKNDAKQLNKLLNAVDQLATEVEKIAAIVSEVDTNDIVQKEAVRKKVEKQIMDLSTSFVSVNFRLMWYLGKDILAEKEATQGIIERLETDEGIAFKKSLKHIKLKKELLEKRANDFTKKMEELEFD